MLESILCGVFYIRDVVPSRQLLLKENEEILKSFPHGGIAYVQDSVNFHPPN